MDQNRQTESGKILAEVRANLSTLDTCKLHKVDPASWSFGKKMKCLNCGGMIGGIEISYYIKGYEANGGNADDIWPGYREKSPSKV